MSLENIIQHFLFVSSEKVISEKVAGIIIIC